MKRLLKVDIFQTQPEHVLAKRIQQHTILMGDQLRTNELHVRRGNRREKAVVSLIKSLIVCQQLLLLNELLGRKETTITR